VAGGWCLGLLVPCVESVSERQSAFWAVFVVNGWEWFVNVKPATGRQFWATIEDIPAKFG
jgi:hypothetical protein